MTQCSTFHAEPHPHRSYVYRGPPRLKEAIDTPLMQQATFVGNAITVSRDSRQLHFHYSSLDTSPPHKARPSPEDLAITGALGLIVHESMVPTNYTKPQSH